MLELDQDQKQIKRKKGNAGENAYSIFVDQLLTLNAFKSEVFVIKISQEKRHPGILDCVVKAFDWKQIEISTT